MPFLFDFLIVVVLVLMNGFFVATEFALVRSHPTKLKNPEMASKFGTRSALAVIKDMDLILSATQLGITVASLLLGWWGERTFSHAIVTLCLWLNIPFSIVVIELIAVALALGLITIAHVVIGELAAKSLAIRYPEATLRFLSPLMRVLSNTFRPAIFILNEAANMFLGLFGLKAVLESERVHSPNELSMLIEQSSEHGIIDKSEEEMLKGIFGFSSTVAREVMTPRTDLITIPVDSSFDEVLAIITKSGFSRFPIVGETVDDIKGLLLSRDLIAAVPEYTRVGNKNFDIRRIMRECYFVPGTKPIDDLLNELKRRKIHMAIVLDEHGGTDGAITLEDILEEIVGDIYDESDTTPQDVVIQDDGDILIDGGLLVEDVNEKFQLKLPIGDYDTVAGLVLSALGRASRTGDKITIRNGIITQVNSRVLEIEESTNGHEKGGATGGVVTESILSVERVDGNRIETVRVKKKELTPPKPEDETSDSSEVSA